MDYSIVVRIKYEDLLKIGIREELTGWGGEIISYEPKRFCSDNDVKLIEVAFFKKNVDFLELKVADTIRELELQANKNPELLANNKIMILLEKICCLKNFEMIIKEDDAIVEEIIEVSNKNSLNIYEIIADALSWDNPKNLSICNY